MSRFLRAIIVFLAALVLWVSWQLWLAWPASAQILWPPTSGAQIAYVCTTLDRPPGLDPWKVYPGAYSHAVALLVIDGFPLPHQQKMCMAYLVP